MSGAKGGLAVRRGPPRAVDPEPRRCGLRLEFLPRRQSARIRRSWVRTLRWDQASQVFRLGRVGRRRPP